MKMYAGVSKKIKKWISTKEQVRKRKKMRKQATTCLHLLVIVLMGRELERERKMIGESTTTVNNGTMVVLLARVELASERNK